LHSDPNNEYDQAAALLNRALSVKTASTSAIAKQVNTNERKKGRIMFDDMTTAVLENAYALPGSIVQVIILSHLAQPSYLNNSLHISYYL